MAEEDYWQETAQMYEQLIQKPKMTQKLLTKPPFRYIHDIFTSTLEATGYGNGLFDESELDGKAITEKDAKINFLVKLLQLTELVIGEEIDVKPTKIVAGHEPEKTNFFLQQIFRAATAGIDTTPHVMQILGIAGDEGEGEGDGQDQAEAQAQAQAQAEQEALRQQQEADEAKKKKKKDADRKRQQEEEYRAQQEEAERKQKEEMEKQQAHQAQQKAKEQARKQEEQQKQKQNIVKESSKPAPQQQQQQIRQQEEEDEEDQQPVVENRSQFQMAQEGGRHGALVEEARKLMAADADVAPSDARGEDEAGGPKIKMGRIGKKKKPTAGSKDSGAQGSQATDYTKQIRGLAAEKNSNPGGGFNENDIEFMKKAIQVLCQSTNPLGKSIDYVTDDVDSMSKEYEHWRKEAISCSVALDEQRKITEELIHPLQDSLAELEERIKEQLGKVSSIRSQILRNDITISNLLYSVIQTR